MENIRQHAALLLALPLMITGIIILLHEKIDREYTAYGFMVMGFLFFLIWLGQRNDR